ncbi:MAG: GNAT family N-acetyltransferase, partial [Actinomycetota bacterium]
MTSLPVSLGDGAVLRRFTPDDLAVIWAAVEGDRERFGRWMPWVEVTRTIDDERRWLASVTAGDSLEGCGVFVGDDLAGSVALMTEPFRVTGEIGYWVRSGHEGRGLITRAVVALIDEAFDHVGLHRVCIRAGVGNTRSRAVPERLGFVQEGVLRGEGRGTGGFYDLVVYGML